MMTTMRMLVGDGMCWTMSDGYVDGGDDGYADVGYVDMGMMDVDGWIQP